MKTWAKWALVIGAVVAIVAAVTQKDRDALRAERERPPTEAEAKALAQRLVAQQCVAATLKRLHDPASAQMPNALSDADYPSQFYVGERRKGELSIQYDMRAKNGFGALRAHTVTCTFNETKTGYTFGNIEIRQQ